MPKIRDTEDNLYKLNKDGRLGIDLKIESGLFPSALAPEEAQKIEQALTYAAHIFESGGSSLVTPQDIAKVTTGTHTTVGLYVRNAAISATTLAVLYYFYSLSREEGQEYAIEEYQAYIQKLITQHVEEYNPVCTESQKIREYLKAFLISPVMNAVKEGGEIINPLGNGVYYTALGVKSALGFLWDFPISISWNYGFIPLLKLPYTIPAIVSTEASSWLYYEAWKYFGKGKDKEIGGTPWSYVALPYYYTKEGGVKAGKLYSWLSPIFTKSWWLGTTILGGGYTVGKAAVKNTSLAVRGAVSRDYLADGRDVLRSAEFGFGDYDQFKATFDSLSDSQKGRFRRACAILAVTNGDLSAFKAVINLPKDLSSLSKSELDFLKSIFNQHCNAGSTILHVAIASGNAKLVEYILDLDAKVTGQTAEPFLLNTTFVDDRSKISTPLSYCIANYKEARDLGDADTMQQFESIFLAIALKNPQDKHVLTKALACGMSKETLVKLCAHHGLYDIGKHAPHRKEDILQTLAYAVNNYNSPEVFELTWRYIETLAKAAFPTMAKGGINATMQGEIYKGNEESQRRQKAAQEGANKTSRWQKPRSRFRSTGQTSIQQVAEAAIKANDDQTLRAFLRNRSEYAKQILLKCYESSPGLVGEQLYLNLLEKAYNLEKDETQSLQDALTYAIAKASDEDKSMLEAILASVTPELISEVDTSLVIEKGETFFDAVEGEEEGIASVSSTGSLSDDGAIESIGLSRVSSESSLYSEGLFDLEAQDPTWGSRADSRHDSLTEESRDKQRAADTASLLEQDTEPQQGAQEEERDPKVTQKTGDSSEEKQVSKRSNAITSYGAIAGGAAGAIGCVVAGVVFGLGAVPLSPLSAIVAVVVVIALAAAGVGYKYKRSTEKSFVESLKQPGPDGGKGV